MNIFNILTEARGSSNNKSSIHNERHISKPMSIVVEAEKDDPDSNKPNTDEDTDDKETNKDELDTPDSSNDDIEPASDIDDNSNDGTNDEESIVDDGIDPIRTKSVALMDDCITLYYSIKNTIDKLSNATSENVDSLKNFIEARDNFVVLADLLYSFITKRFNTNPYVKNLYIFNYFIQTYKLNIEILEKTLKSE